MIYLDTHETQTIVVNGTNCTRFVFTNNQTQQTYTVDLLAVEINPLGQRKQLSFLLKWTDTATDTGTGIVNGVNIIRVPAGEYNYTLGEVCGIMKLVSAAGGTVYSSESINKVYNG